MRPPLMSVTLLALLALLCGVATAAPFGVVSAAHRRYIRRHIQHRYLSADEVSAAAAAASEPRLLEPRWYAGQVLDHFNADDTRTWAQRYYANEQFWRGDGHPVFVLVDGEGAASPLDAMKGHHVELAQKHHALVLAVEHRFYGASIPTPDLSTDNLRYLSSEQALADLAQFLHFAKREFGWSSSSTVITFGGSYPGSLSAWFRIKYPHLAFAAVASSAPVRAQVDFFGYNEVVKASLGAHVVGGSPECVHAVDQAFAEVEIAIQQGNLRDLEQRFNACSPLRSEGDILQLVSSLAGVFQGSVQYNERLPLNISAICKVMTNESSLPLERLEKLYAQTSSECSDYSYDNSLAELKNVTADTGASGVSDRQWLYQTCAEMGYYQTCSREDYSHCIFSSRMDLRSNLVLCKDLFGIDPEVISRRVHFTNDMYGADHPAGSRILFVNGAIDPWHFLSVLHPIGFDHEDAVFIQGASHCQDMAVSTSTDSTSLRLARSRIADQVQQWLDMASSQHAAEVALY